MSRGASLPFAAFIAAACLCLLSCETLMDGRAWGSGAREGAAAGSAGDQGRARPAESPHEEDGASKDNPSRGSPGAPSTSPSPAPPQEEGPSALARRISSAGGSGSAVIKAAMARVEKGLVLKGSCFDFVNAVYGDAGYPPGKRATVFSGKDKGPFADPSLLRPGDWVQFTHMYSATLGHSAVFVSWIDFENRTALTIDYPGNGRAEPGRYRVADLYKVWGIVRAGG